MRRAGLVPDVDWKKDGLSSTPVVLRGSALQHISGVLSNLRQLFGKVMEGLPLTVAELPGGIGPVEVVHVLAPPAAVAPGHVACGKTPA